ncbi:MAG: transcriptional repressor [Anaerolineae bacterium]|nr:transcriptional repressor [Anaerolineae bacterium]MCX8067675.1 transcriptional repressor [Anaerolineae bacterium]
MNAVVRRLREQGYRLTPQRMAVLQAVLKGPGHLSAEDIYQQVADAFPMMSLATVYKTLEVLRDLGEVVELSVEGQARYDGNPRPHVHLICEKCRAVMDWSAEVDFPVAEAAIVASGFRPSYYRLEVYGLCPRCQASDDGKAPVPPQVGLKNGEGRVEEAK